MRRQGVPASGVDASLAAARPIWHALLMTAVCVCVMGMLTVYASPGAFATSSVGLSLAGHELPRVQVMQIELPEIVLMLWDAEAYPLMAVAGFSMGSWPFIKLLLTLFSLWAPASVLPPARRGRLLLWFDLLGKVALSDIPPLLLPLPTVVYQTSTDSGVSLRHPLRVHPPCGLRPRVGTHLPTLPEPRGCERRLFTHPHP